MTQKTSPKSISFYSCD